MRARLPAYHHIQVDGRSANPPPVCQTVPGIPGVPHHSSETHGVEEKEMRVAVNGGRIARKLAIRFSILVLAINLLGLAVSNGVAAPGRTTQLQASDGSTATVQTVGSWTWVRQYGWIPDCAVKVLRGDVFACWRAGIYFLFKPIN